MRRRRHVAIVGGGFSGVALAAQLLRAGRGAVRTTLLECGARVGRGIAYSTTNPAHLLNTRAGRMSLFSDDPDHFVRWNRARARYITPTDFVPRSLYGAYLDDTLQTLAAGVPRATFCTMTGVEATDIEPLAHGFAVKLGDSATLPADEVVLATGHPLPADPLARWLPRDLPRYVRDPWSVERLDSIGRDERVLLLGSGLTMVDVALTLAGRGHTGSITALSRRGLAPRAHGAAHEPLPADVAEALRRGLSLGNLRRAVRAVREAAATVTERGLHWQCVVDALRGSTELFWGALCAADRRRFVQRLRPYWDVHRHRLPPATAARLGELQDDGRLRIAAGHVSAAAANEQGVEIAFTRRGAALEHAHYDWIVNCTGSSFARDTCRPLERRLLERGLLIVDPLALGFLTTPAGIAFGARGPVAGLHVLGPACRSQRWEHTAVPELREQTRTLAATLLGRDQRAPSSLRQR